MLFDCQHCEFEKEVSDKYAGKKVKCPKCGELNLLAGKIIGTTEVQTSKSDQVIHTNDENVYSLSDFLDKHKEKKSSKKFELESDRILELRAEDGVWIKSGSMISYKGDVEFVREKILQFGIKKLLKEFISTEGSRLTKASGSGSVFVADSGKKITLLKLKNETIIVNGNDILAFEKGIKWDIEMMKGLGAIVSSGLFNMKLSGSGYVAISTHYDPLVLEVGGKHKITTDPHATVAWSGGVSPSFKSQFQKKTFLGRGSGDTIQMSFSGKGFVVVQPYEEKGVGTKPATTNAPPAVAVVVIFFMITFYSVFNFKAQVRNPANVDSTRGEIMSTQLEIKQLDTLIKEKGTQVTDAERNKLRSLKKRLRELEIQ